MQTGSPSPWSPSSATGCCDQSSDCVDPSGTCQNYAYVTGDRVCGTSSYWVDCDYNSDACSTCGGDWGAGSGDCSGEVCTSNCCGDDAGEYYDPNRCPTTPASVHACCDSSSDYVQPDGSCAPGCPGQACDACGGNGDCASDLCLNSKCVGDWDECCDTGGSIRSTGYMMDSDRTMCNGQNVWVYCNQANICATSATSNVCYCSSNTDISCAWGTVAPVEDCDDTKDNDCDGPIDCLDTDSMDCPFDYTTPECCISNGDSGCGDDINCCDYNSGDPASGDGCDSGTCIPTQCDCTPYCHYTWSVACFSAPQYCCQVTEGTSILCGELHSIQVY